MGVPQLQPQIPVREVLQLLLVELPGYDHTMGILTAWERAEEHGLWHKAMDFPVSVGKQGATFGKGWIHWDSNAAEKCEGDLKTPLGMFPILSAYGYAEPPVSCQLPYLQVQPWHKCVDDPQSRYYNTIVDDRIAEKDWRSAEDMLRTDHLYKWGIVIGYNTSPPVPGKGSAIFMHLWRTPGHPTAGCTAMSEENMLRLLAWLRPDPRPVLLQTTSDLRNTLLTTCGWTLPT